MSPIGGRLPCYWLQARLAEGAIEIRALTAAAPPLFHRGERPRIEGVAQRFESLAPQQAKMPGDAMRVTRDFSLRVIAIAAAATKIATPRRATPAISRYRHVNHCLRTRGPPAP